MQTLLIECTFPPPNFFASDERYSLNPQSAWTVSNKLHQRLTTHLQLQFQLFIISGEGRQELHQKFCPCDAVILKEYPQLKLSKIPIFFLAENERFLIRDGSKLFKFL